MIEAQGLVKVYGNKPAVQGVSFTVQPGRVTGFLGPNGAGKSTTMRMIMGLDRPTSGTVTVNGKPYARHRSPLSEVGTLLDAKAVHTGRSARPHLRTMAATHNIAPSRVDEVIEMTRLPVLAAKAIALAVTTVVVASASIALSYLAAARGPELHQPGRGADGRRPPAAAGLRLVPRWR